MDNYVVFNKQTKQCLISVSGFPYREKWDNLVTEQTLKSESEADKLYSSLKRKDGISIVEGSEAAREIGTYKYGKNSLGENCYGPISDDPYGVTINGICYKYNEIAELASCGLYNPQELPKKSMGFLTDAEKSKFDCQDYVAESNIDNKTMRVSEFLDVVSSIPNSTIERTNSSVELVEIISRLIRNL